MEPRFLLAAMAAFSTFGVDGRAVNISTAWFLPEEGFPVFYRYFEDKLSWNVARDACGSHHADLLSVQTSGQADAARAYLKEIDAADSVWIGLQRESPEEPFSWTNGEKLLGDGNWAEPPPKSTEKLCVAVDPAGDFRWNAHYCGGPEVASFVCELAVPEWARKDNGCLMSSLPSLTVTFIPDAGVIQLLSDCGLDGTRRIACNQRASRDEIIKHLSCDVDAFTGSTSGGATRQTDINNHISPHDTTRSYRPLTRHRRAAPSTPSTTPTPNKHLPHAFPHSPYLASERNAPSTPKTPRPAPAPSPNTTPPPTSPPTPNNQPLPVLVITADVSAPNDSLPSPVPDTPPIVLMIDDQNLHGPFVLPVADDIIINDPSLSPLQIISVDLMEMDNLTSNSTNNVTTPVTPQPAPVTPLPSPGPLSPRTAKPDAGETPLNAVEAESKKTEVSRKPKRGRVFIHPSRSSYPRLLTRLLG